MTDIAELERRIAFALARIGTGVDQLITERTNARANAAAVAEAEAPEGAEVDADFALTAAVGIEGAGEIAAEDADGAGIFAPAVDQPVGPDAESLARIAELTEALEAERAASAQLAERVRAIREKQETTLATMERRLAEALGAQQASLTEVARLRRANAELTAANNALLEAGGDLAPHLVNSAMRAELEAMRAARAAEARELDEIIEGIEPLLAAKGLGRVTEGESHA